MERLLSSQLFGRPAASYLIALAILLGVLLTTQIADRWIVTRLRRAAVSTSSELDDLFADLLHRTVLPFGRLLAVWLAARQLNLPPRAERMLSTVLLLLGAVIGARTGTSFAGRALRGYFGRRSGGDVNAAQVLQPIVAIVVWAIAVVFVLDNVGVKISTVLAGLGIGGIAVALAAQAVLGDLFAYVAIVIDRPFAIGDFIVVGEAMGTVERIGIKTTRVRSLGGELIVFGNASLVSTRVHNFKLMEKRRVVLRFGITYGASSADLAAVPPMVNAIISANEGVVLERGHFKGFGESSLEFEFVYWVQDPDYNRFMNIQQAVNLAVKEQVEGLGLSFAFPTRTVHVVGQSAPAQP